ncbi:MAG: hypothetical protein CVV53_06150, partial [Spirochaetae bacterium HGW-Spirochaetae-9]
MGAVELIPWRRCPIDELQALGPIFALELGGCPMDEFAFPEKGLLILGSEELGVSASCLTLAGERRVSIPMRGIKASINVAVAFGIAAAWAIAKYEFRGKSFLTTLIDFTDTGILDVFIDEAFVKFREMQMGKGGLLKGQDLASTFSFLRPNDLVWNYVVGNYLKGESPPPFDLLYWNSDATNLPGP